MLGGTWTPERPEAQVSGQAHAAAVKPWIAVLLSVIVGLLAGVMAVLWQGWATVLLQPMLLVIPWGALLASLLIGSAALSLGLRAGYRWVPGLVGLCAFAVLAAVSMGGHDTLMVPLDSRYAAVAPGGFWSAVTVTAGAVVATIVALLLVAVRVPAVQRTKRR